MQTWLSINSELQGIQMMQKIVPLETFARGHTSIGKLYFSDTYSSFLVFFAVLPFSPP